MFSFLDSKSLFHEKNVDDNEEEDDEDEDGDGSFRCADFPKNYFTKGERIYHGANTYNDIIVISPFLERKYQGKILKGGWFKLNRYARSNLAERDTEVKITKSSVFPEYFMIAGCYGKAQLYSAHPNERFYKAMEKKTGKKTTRKAPEVQPKVAEALNASGHGKNMGWRKASFIVPVGMDVSNIDFEGQYGIKVPKGYALAPSKPKAKKARKASGGTGLGYTWSRSEGWQLPKTLSVSGSGSGNWSGMFIPGTGTIGSFSSPSSHSPPSNFSSFSSSTSSPSSSSSSSSSSSTSPPSYSTINTSSSSSSSPSSPPAADAASVAASEEEDTGLRKMKRSKKQWEEDEFVEDDNGGDDDDGFDADTHIGVYTPKTRKSVSQGSGTAFSKRKGIGASAKGGGRAGGGEKGATRKKARLDDEEYKP